jgi:hypothetical protein
MTIMPFPTTVTIRGAKDWKSASLPRFLIYLGFTCIRLLRETGQSSLERTP